MSEGDNSGGQVSGGLRTDPKSFIVRGISMLGQLAIPIAIASFTIFNDGDLGDLAIFFLPIVLVIIAANFIITYLQWARLTYSVGTADIRVDSGVLSRSARSVPFERIQDVSLEHKLIPRLFSLVAVKFETGAGGGEDLSLSYLSNEEGERLRQVVRERREGEALEAGAGADSPQPAVAEEDARTLFAMDPRRLLIFGTFEFSLAVFAVLAGLFQYVDTFAGVSLWDPDLWTEWLGAGGSTVAAMGGMAQVLGVTAGLIAILVVGSATGLVRTFLRDWDFLLERTARGFRRRRGLLTKTDVVMPIHRVQGITIGTRLIRYRFGWHSLRFISLAQDAGAASHVVAPFAQLDEIAPIVEEAGFALPAGDTDWHRASEKYRTDSMIMDAAIFVLPAMITGPIVAYNAPEWAWLVVTILLVLAAVSAAAALYAWQFKRHALDARQIMSRSGLLSPQTQISTRLKLHSIEIAQGPIARKRGYATLHLGLAGGVFQIPGVPIDRARAVRREAMTTIAATDFSQLEHA